MCIRDRGSEITCTNGVSYPLLAKTRELIAACPCDNGCPSCVGPVGERGERAKEAALAILQRLGA